MWASIFVSLIIGVILGVVFKFRHGGLTEAERNCKVHKKEQCLRAGTTICEYDNCSILKAYEEETKK